MNINNINNIYFIGIGGIGMSALARYFNFIGKTVAGYDRTPSRITDALKAESIDIHFEDKVQLIPQTFFEKQNTLIVYTPAIPKNHSELNYFVENQYNIHKRSEILGALFNNKFGVAVAGTHGKTSVSTMIAYLLHYSTLGCSAVLGGLSKNFQSNLILSTESEVVVTEADEFDRSFLRLNPNVAVITSTDADHLDIYGDALSMQQSYSEFASKIKTGGTLIVKKGIPIDLTEARKTATIFSYSLENDADFYPTDMQQTFGFYTFSLQTPEGKLDGFRMGVPFLTNVENAVAAIAASLAAGANVDEIRANLIDYEGVIRRFDFQTKPDAVKVYIDDYAHHPTELRAIITSVRTMYPKRKITGIFQPHLFTRTRDFADGFAESLSLLDELILLDIYPARELPIEGVTSEIIFRNVTLQQKKLCNKAQLLDVLKQTEIDVLLTVGAGDIDRFVEPIRKMIENE